MPQSPPQGRCSSSPWRWLRSRTPGCWHQDHNRSNQWLSGPGSERRSRDSPSQCSSWDCDHSRGRGRSRDKCWRRRSDSHSKCWRVLSTLGCLLSCISHLLREQWWLVSRRKRWAGLRIFACHAQSTQPKHGPVIDPISIYYWLDHPGWVTRTY